MTDKLKQTIKEEVGKLPSYAQNVINSFNWVGKIEEIGRKHLLEEFEINNLLVETLLVLIGVKEYTSYAKNVEDEVGTSEKEAVQIATEVIENIFVPIADSITENIKKNIKDKPPGWEGSVNFILSGGNYATFIEQKKKLDAEDTEKPLIPVFPIKN
jgi:hypothetical protein